MGSTDDQKSNEGARFRDKGLIRALLILAGTLCVALGILGIVLPVLPTTPFLLLAAVCYARSSRRFYHWLMTNRWFGSYVRRYQEGKGIPVKLKILAILLLWLVSGYAVWFVATLWWVRLILCIVAIGVTIHLMAIKTSKPEGKK
jgi:uncharacterized membrane protein YbaN (DUF454 family)